LDRHGLWRGSPAPFPAKSCGPIAQRQRTARAIRKSIAASGHLNEIVEIDTLLAVARSESDKRMAVISGNSHRTTKDSSGNLDLWIFE
jgi:hypothetical protein